MNELPPRSLGEPLAALPAYVVSTKGRMAAMPNISPAIFVKSKCWLAGHPNRVPCQTQTECAASANCAKARGRWLAARSMNRSPIADGWTRVTKVRSLPGLGQHMIAVKPEVCEVLTAWSVGLGLCGGAMGACL